MCYVVVQQLFDMRNLFTLFCTTLTLILIYQELVAFTMTRPTSNYRKEKELETTDIPEIVLCLEPGFDFGVLEQYGYNTDTYYRGSMDGKSFVGWNSGEGETRSSKEILEEALLVDGQLLLAKSLLSANFSDDHVDHIPAEMKLKKIAYPFGRCISFSMPPSQNDLSSLYISFNKTAFHFSKMLSDKVRVFFMDKANSIQIYPNHLEMMGDPIKIGIREPSSWISYKIKVSRFEHVQDDPLLDCGVYTTDNSYNVCILDELLNLIEDQIGCHPPLLVKDEKHMCNKRFNVSTAESRTVQRLLKPLYFHDYKFNCRTPCTSNVYTTKYVQTSPSHDNATHLVLVFDKTVEVGHSVFSIDGQTFLTRLGGSVASGRTLLWILLSLFGALQVILSLLGEAFNRKSINLTKQN